MEWYSIYIFIIYITVLKSKCHCQSVQVLNWSFWANLENQMLSPYYHRKKRRRRRRRRREWVGERGEGGRVEGARKLRNSEFELQSSLLRSISLTKSQTAVLLIRLILFLHPILVLSNLTKQIGLLDSGFGKIWPLKGHFPSIWSP